MSGKLDHPDHKGIIPRAVELIFDTLQKYKDDGVLTQETCVKMSCLELHCETIQDLLNIENKTTQLVSGG